MSLTPAPLNSQPYGAVQMLLQLLWFCSREQRKIQRSKIQQWSGYKCSSSLASRKLSWMKTALNNRHLLIAKVITSEHTPQQDTSYTVSQNKDEKPTWKLYSRVIWTFPPNVIKIDHYHFKRHHFKVSAFVETECRSSSRDRQTDKLYWPCCWLSRTYHPPPCEHTVRGCWFAGHAVPLCPE